MNIRQELEMGRDAHCTLKAFHPRGISEINQHWIYHLSYGKTAMKLTQPLNSILILPSFIVTACKASTSSLLGTR